jgi:hypothetical protein
MVRNPPHPGELIDDNVSEIGVSVGAAARELGTTPPDPARHIAGRSRIAAEMALPPSTAGGAVRQYDRLGIEPDAYHFTWPGEILRCPWHGREFDVCTGQSTTSPSSSGMRWYSCRMRQRPARWQWRRITWWSRRET